MKIIGRVLILATFCAVTYLLFSDVFSYWTGFGSSRIASLDVGKLTFIRDDRIRFGGPGIHFKEVKYYKTAQGDEIAMFQTGTQKAPGALTLQTGGSGLCKIGFRCFESQKRRGRI